MTRGKVYLSGPITGCSYQGCTDWREFARGWLNDFGIEGLSPMRGKEYLRDAELIHDGMTEVLAHAMSQDASIVTRDRWDTTNADFMLVNLLGATQVSIGTMVELGWADAARVPVVLVMEPQGNLHEHAFVRQLSGYRVDSVEAGLDLIVAAMGKRPL